MKKISIIIFFLFIQTNVFSIEKQRITDDDQWSEKISALNWKNRDQVEHSTAIKKANANVLILDEEIYLDNFKDINQYNWWSFGHEAEQDTVKLIKGDGYTIYLDYVGDGYINLDDWSNVNPKDLLKQMRETAKINAEYLKSRNLDYVNQIDWIYEPTLNKENKSVSYSYKVTWSSGLPTMESKNLILGKKGHLETAFVVSYNKDMDLKLQSDFSKDFVNGVTFEDGFKHSDYKAGDKIAAAGIGGLVAGSLGVKALAKTGILVKLAKFWWILLAPLAFLGKFLSGKESSASTNEKSSIRRRKRKK